MKAAGIIRDGDPVLLAWAVSFRLPEVAAEAGAAFAEPVVMLNPVIISASAETDEPHRTG